MWRKLCCLPALLLFNSCNSETAEIGSDFFDSDEMQVITIDTLTVRASTVIFDSLNTYSPDRLLVGHSEDPDLGPVTATPYFEIYPNTETVDKNTTRYSRAILRLTYDKYSYYDTAVETSLSVHRITERMELFEDDELYTTSSFEYDEQPLGSITFFPKPHKYDTVVEIPISDELGQEFFELVQNSSNVLNSTEDFLNYFNGIVIVPDQENNGSIIGFNKDPQLRIYYWIDTSVPIREEYLDFSSANSIKFNQIQTDRSSTTLNTLKDKKDKISSAETDHTVYMQAGAGIGIRVEIPYLKDIMLASSNLIISDAILQLVPVKGSYEKNAGLPATMHASGNNSRNEVYYSSASTAYLMEDVDLGRDTRYEADISGFLNDQLSRVESNKNGLIFSMTDSDFRFSVDRVYIGDQESEFKMKLSLRYIIVNE